MTDLSLVSESVGPDSVLFAFLRKLHPSVLPCAYFSFGTTDIEEHHDAGNAVRAFLCLQLKMLCEAQPGQLSHYLVTQKLQGLSSSLLEKQDFSSKS